MFPTASPMAPKRPSPLHETPAGSSSEEEETTSGEAEVALKEGSSSEEEEEEEEEEIPQKPKNVAPLPSASATDDKLTPKKKDPPSILHPQESSTDSLSESESESDAEAEKVVKPIASKPMEGTLKRQKLHEDRPSQNWETKRAKEGSGSAVPDLETEKTGNESRKLFQRLWSEEDEIAILKGIGDFKAKKGHEPPADMISFHYLVRKHLHIDVSTAQLRDKVRRLKKKYKNNLRRGKTGEDPTFTKAHEQQAFELAKKVWGGEVATPMPDQPKFSATPKRNRMASSSKSLKKELLERPKLEENGKLDAGGNLAPSECWTDFLDFMKIPGVGGLPESLLKRGLELIEGSKKAELNEQWKALHLAELELLLRRTELARDQARLILEAYKSSNK